MFLRWVDIRSCWSFSFRQVRTQRFVMSGEGYEPKRTSLWWLVCWKVLSNGLMALYVATGCYFRMSQEKCGERHTVKRCTRRLQLILSLMTCRQRKVYQGSLNMIPMSTIRVQELAPINNSKFP
jgi:hypothetical protein